MTIVSVTTETLHAVKALSERVAPDFEAAFAELRNFGTAVATETGWNGRTCDQWQAGFADSVNALAARVGEDLVALEAEAVANYEAIMAAGGH